MAGALFDVHAVYKTWTVGAEVAGAGVSDGIFGPAGERLLSAYGYVQFGGGKAYPFAIERYGFGDIYNYETSEGCWARLIVPAECDQVGGTAHLWATFAKETNPE